MRTPVGVLRVVRGNGIHGLPRLFPRSRAPYRRRVSEFLTTIAARKEKGRPAWTALPFFLTEATISRA
ncbi:MAG: hypothetical protein IH997_01540 [Proteobacteria bacterium]|nr:hypothetical protein [Pseudomonadota bacterium]